MTPPPTSRASENCVAVPREYGRDDLTFHPVSIRQQILLTLATPSILKLNPHVDDPTTVPFHPPFPFPRSVGQLRPKFPRIPPVQPKVKACDTTPTVNVVGFQRGGYQAERSRHQRATVVDVCSHWQNSGATVDVVAVERPVDDRIIGRAVASPQRTRNLHT